MFQAEEEGLRAARMRVAEGGADFPAWNHWEFHASYPSLAKQLCIGGIYVRLLLEGLDKVRCCGALHYIDYIS